ncbi:MAG: hypothetical protein ACRDG3_02820, partial [Tepidiformaceae bacterium]
MSDELGPALAVSLAAREGFSAFRQGFDDAVAAAGELLERNFRIGGYVIRLQFAGAGLVTAITAP